MQNKITKYFFLLATLFLLPNFALAAVPTISTVTGTVANGNTLTINGENMMSEVQTNWDHSGAVNFTTSAGYGFEGNRNAGQYGQMGDGWATSQYNVDMYTTDVKLSGNQSAHFHVVGGGDINVSSSLYDWATAVNPPQMWLRGYSRWDGTGWPANYIKMWWTGGDANNFLVLQPGTEADGPALPSTFYYGGSQLGWVHTAIPSGTLKLGRWYCVELEMKVVSGHVNMTPWIDGVQGATTITGSTGINVSGGWQEIGVVNLRGLDSPKYVDHYEDNFAMSQNGRIYPSSIIELSGNGTTWVYQEPLSLGDNQSSIKVDLNGVAGTNYQIKVTNNQNQSVTCAIGVNCGGGVTDTTPPSAPSGLSVV